MRVTNFYEIYLFSLGFLYRQLEPQRALSLTDRRDRSIYYSTAQSRV